MNDYLTALEMLKKTAADATSPLEGFNRRDYMTTFEQRYQSLLPAFDAIERLYQSVGEPESMLANMASAYVETSREYLETLPRRKKEQAMMNLNMSLAVFVFPAILHYKGDSSKPLSQALESAWHQAFPDSLVSAAEVEYIEKGFHRKFCFITTAVCETLGKEDDCYELTMLRRYRDGYLSDLPEGKAWIRTYYDVAPTIVKHIDARPDREAIYTAIWKEHIRPCISLIENDQKAACAERYRSMVEELKGKYFYLA